MNLGSLASLAGRYKWGTLGSTIAAAYGGGLLFATQTLAVYIPAMGTHTASQVIAVTAAVAAAVTFFIQPQKAAGDANYLAPNNPVIPPGAQIALSNGVQLVPADQLAEAQRAKEAAEADAAAVRAQLENIRALTAGTASTPAVATAPAGVGE